MGSCAVESDGLSHSRPTPATPGPDDCPSLQAVAEAGGGIDEYWEDFAAIEIRVAPDTRGTYPHSASPPNSIWMRSTDRLPDEPTYTSLRSRMPAT